MDVYGGFAGTEATRNERDPESYATILSGNTGGSSPARHVVSAEDVTATLDGLTISDGSAGYSDERGGGLHIVGGALTLRDLLVTRNQATFGGGAHISGGNHRIEGVRFHANNASTRTTVSAPNGAGLRVEDATLTLHDTEFSSNRVGSFVGFGGANALTAYRSNVSTSFCTFRSNRSIDGYFGVTIFQGIFTSSNDSFYRNGHPQGPQLILTQTEAHMANAVFSGGYEGVIASSTQLEVANSLFIGLDAVALRTLGEPNSAITATNVTILETRQAARVDAGHAVRLQNAIILSDQIATSGHAEQVSVTNGLIPGGYTTGENITDGHPDFAVPPAPGPDGVWGTLDDPPFNLSLLEDSSGIDAGDPSLLPPDVLDLDGDGDTSEPLPLDAAGGPRQRGTTVDLGTYESPYSVLPEPPPTAPLPAAFSIVGVGPNPARERVTFRLDAPEQIVVSIVVVDALARRVLTPATRTLEAGAGQSVEVSVQDLPTGVYAYRLTADGERGLISHEGRFTVIR